MPLTWTDEEIATLRSAIASGVKRVTYRDETVEYHSLDQMRELLASMTASASESSSSNGTYRLASTRKGL